MNNQSLHQRRPLERPKQNVDSRNGKNCTKYRQNGSVFAKFEYNYSRSRQNRFDHIFYNFFRLRMSFDQIWRGASAIISPFESKICLSSPILFFDEIDHKINLLQAFGRRVFSSFDFSSNKRFLSTHGL